MTGPSRRRRIPVGWVRRIPVGWACRIPVGWACRTPVGRTGAPTCSSRDRPAAVGGVAGDAGRVVRRAGGSPGSGLAGVGARGVRCRADGGGAVADRGAVPVRVPRRGAGGRCRARPRDRVRSGEHGQPKGRGRPSAVVGMGRRAHPGSPGARPAAGAHRCSPVVRRADHVRHRAIVPTGSGSEVKGLRRLDQGHGGHVPGAAPRPVRVSSPVLDAGRGRPAGFAPRACAMDSGRRTRPSGRTDRSRSRCGGGSVPSRGRPRGNRAALAIGLGRPPGAPRRAVGGAVPRRSGRGGRPVPSRSDRCRSRRDGSAPAGALWPGRQRQLARAGRAAGCARYRCRRGSAGRGTEDATRWSARPSRTARRGGATDRRSRRDSSARPIAGLVEGIALARMRGLGGTWRGRPFAFGRAPMTGSRPLAHGDCHLVAPCRAGHPPAGSFFRLARCSCGRRVAAWARSPPLWRPRGTQTLSHVPEIWAESGPEFRHPDSWTPVFVATGGRFRRCQRPAGCRAGAGSRCRKGTSGHPSADAVRSGRRWRPGVRAPASGEG